MFQTLKPFTLAVGDRSSEERVDNTRGHGTLFLTPASIVTERRFSSAGKIKRRCEEDLSPTAKIAGFTLIELAISIVLISILLGAIYLVYDAGFRTTYQQWTRTGVKGEVGRAMITIGNDLRQAASVTSATETEVTFTVDADGNGVDETVQYTWGGVAGDPLNRVQSAPAPSYTNLEVSSVNSLAFSYYDATNTLLSFPVTASQVRRVVLDITVLDKQENFELRTSFRLRNLS